MPPCSSIDALRTARLTAFVVVVVLFLATLAVWIGRTGVKVPPRSGPSPAAVAPQFGIDPNTAAWEELALLPGVGASLARRIVEFREEARHAAAAGDGPVFQQPSDLAQVHGIGDKMVRRMAPFLRIEATSGAPGPRGARPPPSTASNRN